MTDKTYEDGLIEGRVKGLERTADKHGVRLDSHSVRLRLMERLIWVGGGIIFAIQSLPLWQDVVRKIAGID